MIFGIILIATGLITGLVVYFTEHVEVPQAEPFKPQPYSYRTKAYDWRS